MNESQIIFLEKRVRQLNLLVMLLALTVLLEVVALIFGAMATADLKVSVKKILIQRDMPN